MPSDFLRRDVIQFHANFLCVETFHAEVGCSGVLFNDPYGSPVVPLDEQAKAEVMNLIERIRKEQSNSDPAFGEVMLAYLKILLILAARLKSPKAGACVPGANDLRHPVLVQLRDLIEQNFHSLHSPADYAMRLHLTAKTLGRIVRDDRNLHDNRCKITPDCPAGAYRPRPSEGCGTGAVTAVLLRRPRLNSPVTLAL